MLSTQSLVSHGRFFVGLNGNSWRIGRLRYRLQRRQQKSPAGFHPESAAFWKWVGLNSAGTCGMALSSGCRIVMPEVCDALAGTSDLDAYRRSHFRAVQTIPLIARTGHLVGMISTHWRKPHRPSARELQLLDVLAQQATELMERNESGNSGGSLPSSSPAMMQSSARMSTAPLPAGTKAPSGSSATWLRRRLANRLPSRFHRTACMRRTSF
jgi:hypothetical protein